MRILLPKDLVAIDLQYGPFFFIAGPVKGAGDWQRVCCERIQETIQDFTAALPCRYPQEHPLMKYRVRGEENFFARQLAWERYYLKMAAKKHKENSSLLFWLPCESAEHPRDDGKPYAMDTRRELGEFYTRLEYEPDLNVVVGAEASFPGLSQIQRCFNDATGKEFPIYGTLELTIQAALRKAGW